MTALNITQLLHRTCEILCVWLYSVSYSKYLLSKNIVTFEEPFAFKMEKNHQLHFTLFLFISKCLLSHCACLL